MKGTLHERYFTLRLPYMKGTLHEGYFTGSPIYILDQISLIFSYNEKSVEWNQRDAHFIEFIKN
jgi:hypothetical protein